MPDAARFRVIARPPGAFCSRRALREIIFVHSLVPTPTFALHFYVCPCFLRLYRGSLHCSQFTVAALLSQFTVGYTASYSTPLCPHTFTAAGPPLHPLPSSGLMSMPHVGVAERARRM